MSVASSCLLAAACSEAAGPSTETARWARSFLPFEEQWRPLAQVPAKPQASPKMVIWEVSGFEPGSEPTQTQRQFAADLVVRSERIAREKNWYDFQQGLKDGFKLLFADRRHYANEAFILDDRILDPAHPEFLMYYGTPQGKQLAGMMFYARRPDEFGPQPGGPLTLWHYHVWSHRNCLVRGLLLVGLPDKSGGCERGVPAQQSPEMLHIWLVDHPRGPFSTSMFLEPELMARLLKKRESRWAAEASN